MKHYTDGIVKVLDWHARHIDSNSMLSKMPYWNFVDWPAEWPWTGNENTSGIPAGTLTGKNNLVKKELENLVKEGKIYQVTVEGLKTQQLYMLPAYKNKKINLSGDAFILSPFDVLNVFRHRLRDFFNFDYQIECFVPAPKREYGYFSLPVLVGDTFVARMDSKADRRAFLLPAGFPTVQRTMPGSGPVTPMSCSPLLRPLWIFNPLCKNCCLQRLSAKHLQLTNVSCEVLDWNDLPVDLTAEVLLKRAFCSLQVQQ